MRWIVFLRGVNVGGHGKTPMTALRPVLTEAGARNVTTYIQSGNLIFDHPEQDPDAVCAWVSDLIDAQFNHRPPALAFRPDELQTTIDQMPFAAADDPKLLHFHLFRGQPDPSAIEMLTPSLYDGELLHLGQHCLYHWPPKGFGVSKVAQKIPKALGVTTTAPNSKSHHAIL